jgi:hypothetical protein
MKCVHIFKSTKLGNGKTVDDTVVRCSDRKAAELVRTGVAVYTAKKYWKVDGRIYYDGK